MYSFHASTAAYTEFWNNNLLGDARCLVLKKYSCCHIWQAFVQDSIRTVGAASDMHLRFEMDLPLIKLQKKAFEILRENGIMRAADQHACTECISHIREQQQNYWR